MTSTDIIELPHEVEHMFKQAKAQHRIEEKYEGQARAKEGELDRLLKKMDGAHTAVGKYLCAAQDKGIEMGVFPTRGAGRPKSGQQSFAKIASSLTQLSRSTVERYMLEHRAPEVAQTKAQKNREDQKVRDTDKRKKAKAYEAMQKEAEEEQAMEAEVLADLETKATIHILKARCQSALRAKFRRIGDDQGQLEQLAEYIETFGDEA